MRVEGPSSTVEPLSTKDFYDEACIARTVATDFYLGDYSRGSCGETSMLGFKDRYPADVGCEVLRI